MELLIHITIIIHITAGIGALIFGAIAFSLKRNTPKHKPIGRIYFWCMTIIFITGIFLSIARELLFFFYIAIFTYYSTVIAYRSLKLKELHKGQKLYWIDWIIEGVAGITFLGLILFSVNLYFTKHASGAIIPFVFGCIGVWAVISNIKFFIKRPNDNMAWLKKHLGHMMGSYIGAITAFLVNQTDKIPLNPIFLWLGPTLIIVPVIVLELRKVKASEIPSQK